MIESVWAYLKQKMILKEPSHNRKDVRSCWKTEWKALSMTEICCWIEQILQTIQWVIALKDSNEYCEDKNEDFIKQKKAAAVKKCC